MWLPLLNFPVGSRVSVKGGSKGKGVKEQQLENIHGARNTERRATFTGVLEHKLAVAPGVAAAAMLVGPLDDDLAPGVEIHLIHQFGRPDAGTRARVSSLGVIL